MVSSQTEGEEDCQDCCAVLFKSPVVVVAVSIVGVMVFPVRTASFCLTAVRAADNPGSSCLRAEGLKGGVFGERDNIAAEHYDLHPERQHLVAGIGRPLKSSQRLIFFNVLRMSQQHDLHL